jgi:hypothetical protein
MNISSASASAVRLTYAQTMQQRAAAKQAADARKAEIETDKAKAMDTPAFKGAENQKQQAKAKIQQIMEWLKILKKLYAMDPKGMAKALAQVFKDLKAAVKAYKDAGGSEMSASGAAVGAVMANSGPAPASKDDAQQTDAQQAETSPAEGQAADAAEQPDQLAAEAPVDQAQGAGGSGLYQSVVDEVKKSVGEDGLDFIKQVRSVTQEITKLLDTARGQAAIKKRDKEMDRAFEDADKTLKSLHEEMDSMEAEIRREAPTAGMKLSIAA